MKIDLATRSDIRQLAIHHRKMFEEIWDRKGLVLDANKIVDIERAYFEKIRKEMPEGKCKAWVARDGGRIVASGAISIVSLVPVPGAPHPQVAYLHSMYTEKEFRGRKFARRIVEKAVECCKEEGIDRIHLNASDAGKPIYERMGFEPAPDTMRLFINAMDPRAGGTGERCPSD